MRNFIEWISWLSLARYGYSAMIINEYQGRDIPCDPDGSAAISVGDTSSCPLAGEDVISGLGISGVATNFWFNIGILVVLQLAFRFAAYAWLRRTNK